MADSKTQRKQSKSIFDYIGAPFVAVATYIKGSWHEIKQVRWPDRKATWSLTLAVILFSVFFAVVILLLDYLFGMLFQEILL